MSDFFVTIPSEPVMRVTISPGAMGYSGHSGYSGYSGYSSTLLGVSGYSGSGISGWSGYSGKSGYSGYSGFSGYSGYSGLSGYSGYSGKSGYSGEFGHSPVFDNEIICHCGKKGCLETEVSGSALLRKFKKALEDGSKSILSGKMALEEITVDDILTAIIKNEDTLAIEIMEEIGSELGRFLSMLINIFNPELVILGGALAETDMYLRLPIRTAIHKYSLSLVSLDMELKMSALGSKAGVTGACYILRDKLFYSV